MSLTSMNEHYGVYIFAIVLLAFCIKEIKSFILIPNVLSIISIYFIFAMLNYMSNGIYIYQIIDIANIINLSLVLYVIFKSKDALKDILRSMSFFIYPLFVFVFYNIILFTTTSLIVNVMIIIMFFYLLLSSSLTIITNRFYDIDEITTYSSYVSITVLVTIVFVMINIIIAYGRCYIICVNESGGKMEFLDAMYFSTVTWTTLGYGDIVPKGNAKIFAMSEAFMGGISMTLLTSSLIALAQYHIVNIGKTASGNRPSQPVQSPSDLPTSDSN